MYRRQQQSQEHLSVIFVLLPARAGMVVDVLSHNDGCVTNAEARMMLMERTAEGRSGDNEDETVKLVRSYCPVFLFWSPSISIGAFLLGQATSRVADARERQTMSQGVARH